jgi:hypothetical protein
MMNDKGNEMKVTFLNAKDGKIEITYTTKTGVSNTVVASDAMEVAMFAKFLDFSEAYCSSSMDFADEYGFVNGTAAWDMLHRGLDMEIA